MRIRGFCLAILTIFVVVVPAGAQWIGAERVGDTAYFFFGFPARVERYDLASRQWDAPLPLPTVYGLPTAAHADADGMYVAYGNAVYRYDLAGGNETHLLNAGSAVVDVVTESALIFVRHSEFVSINKATNTLLHTSGGGFSHTYTRQGLSIAPGLKRIFGRSSGVSPSDIGYMEYDATGAFTGGDDSPHHGDYPSATQTWVFPDEGRVVDSSGTVYNTSTLSYLNSYGTTIDDIQFLGSDVAIILTGSTLQAYDNRLLPTGSATLPTAPDKFYLEGGDAVLFTPSAAAANGVQVDSMALSTLNPPTPGQPVDPVGLPYTPDETFLDKDGILYLFSKTHQSLFRWDPGAQRYLTTIPLVGVPQRTAYHPAQHRIYVAYDTGLVRKIDLASPTLVEEPLFTVAGGVNGMVAVDDHLFVAPSQAANDDKYATYDADGNRVAGSGYVIWTLRRDYSVLWSSVHNRVYYFRSGSPTDLVSHIINDNGTFGAQTDSPLHTSSGFTNPMVLSPDESVILYASGTFHNALTLERLPTGLANAVTDAAWLGPTVTTIRTISGVTQYQEWTGATFAQGAVKQYPGEAHRLLALDAMTLLGISMDDRGIPSFYVLDGAFDIVAPPALEKPSGLSVSIPAPNQIVLKWTDITGESGYRVERKPSTSSTWVQVGTTGTSVTEFTDVTALGGNSYDYRVIATAGALSSPPSDPVLGVFGPPDAPASLVAKALDDDRIRLDWTDVQFETGYRIERKLSSSTTWSSLTTLGGDVTTYTNARLSPNTSYDYRVLAFNAIGDSVWVVTTAKTDAIPPNTPSLSTPSAGSATTISVSWGSASYADEYVLERQGGGAGWTEIAVVAATSYTDSNLLPQTAYTYRVKARNPAGDSAWSAERSATTPALPLPPTPGALAARPASDSEVLLTWLGVPEAQYFMIQRREGQSGPWADWALVAATSTSFMDTGLTMGATYCYRIASFNVVGTSPYTADVCAVPANLFCLRETDFSDPDYPNWLTVSSGQIISNGGVGFPPGEVAWFGESGTRSLTTEALDLTDGGFLEFVARGGNESRDGSTYWEDPDSGENLAVEFSLDGTNWTEIETIVTTPASFGDWTPFFIEIPAEARSSATSIRWRQVQHSDGNNDVWAVDRLCVLAPVPAPPSAPPFVLAVANTPDSVSLYWAEVPGATEYHIERIEPGGIWANVASVASPMNYHTDTGLTPSTPYAYRLSASGRGGESGVTRHYYVTTLSLLDAWLEFFFPGTSSGDRDEVLAEFNAHGVSVLDQYAYGLDPSADRVLFDPATGARGLPLVAFDPATKRLWASFVRRRADRNPEVEYLFETSTDGRSWIAIGEPVSRATLDADWEEVSYRDSTTSEETPVKFGRVRIRVSSN